MVRKQLIAQGNMLGKRETVIQKCLYLDGFWCSLCIYYGKCYHYYWLLPVFMGPVCRWPIIISIQNMGLSVLFNMSAARKYSGFFLSKLRNICWFFIILTLVISDLNNFKFPYHYTVQPNHSLTCNQKKKIIL